MIAFDIETGPASDEVLDKIAPRFDAPANWKDMDKIALYQAEKKKDWKERAALSAETGRVLAVGIAVGDNDDDVVICYGKSEHETLMAWWKQFDALRRNDPTRKWVGHNIAKFDIPYLIRRSWVNGVTIPCTMPKVGRYLPDTFVDTMQMWAMSDYQETVGLDTLAKCFGVGEKTGHGGDFFGLWLADRKKAIAYLSNDVRLTYRVAQAMQVDAWKPGGKGE